MKYISSAISPVVQILSPAIHNVGLMNFEMAIIKSGELKLKRLTFVRRG
jgi:hypothetical protein